MTALKGQKGVEFARAFKHSAALTVLLGLRLTLQAYAVPWMIP